MGKQLRSRQSSISFDNHHHHHPGCMWGILHILDYHHWRRVKKMLPHKKHAYRRHAGNDMNTPTGESQGNENAEMDNFPIEETSTSPATKRSVKARIKARIAEEMSRRKGKHRRSSTTFSVQSQLTLTRSISIHHLESQRQDPLFEETIHADSPIIAQPKEPINSKEDCEDGGNIHGKKLVENQKLLQEKLDSAKQALLEKKLIDAKEHIRDAPLYQSKEFLDALDIVNLDKELFLKVLQDQDPPLTNQFEGRHKKLGSTKFGSFPVTGSSGKRVVPGELEQKLKKIKSDHVKEEWELQGSSSTENLSELETQYIELGNIVNGYSKADHKRPEMPENATPSSSILKKGNKNQAAIKRFKDLKRRIKHAIRESKKERHRITMDAVFHKIPYGHKFTKDNVKKQPAMDRDGKNRRARRIMRASSFTDSLDRYCQLYESSFNREAKYDSERLKLGTEEVSSPGGNARKSLARIFSLPDLKSYHYLQSQDSFDTLSPWTPVRTNVDSTESKGNSFDDRKTLEIQNGLESKSQLDSVIESETEANLIDGTEINHNIADQAGSNAELHSTINDFGNFRIEDKASHHEEEIGFITGLTTTKLPEPSPISVLDSIHHENMTEFSLLEDSMADRQDYDTTSPAIAATNIDLEKGETIIKHLEGYLLHLEVDTKDKADFNYVRDVLELSGFTKNELLGAWQAADQPVDFSVYEEVEGFFPLEPEFSEKEEATGYCNTQNHHLLLFDLINEVLMGIYDRSFSYWPTPLCSCSHISPMPKGYHVLEQVWASIRWYLSSKPELDPSLDYLVNRDLCKGDGWMTLQFDIECVGLELEDLIFDNLLEEVIYT